MWRFTLYWSFIFYVATHFSVATCALAMQGRSWRILCFVPLLYLFVGGLEAFLAGSIVGGLYVVSPLSLLPCLLRSYTSLVSVQHMKLPIFECRLGHL